MAQTHIDHFAVRPLSAAQRQQALQRTHNMLVVTIVGTMIVVVVAALFMTMF
jgi:hypothetical protein